MGFDLFVELTLHRQFWALTTHGKKPSENTTWEKEKILLTSIISFSHNIFCFINSLPNDKVLHLSKLTAFEDYNLNVYQKLKYALGRVENIVGKGENAGYTMSSLGSLKVGIVWYRVKKRILPFEPSL